VPAVSTILREAGVRAAPYQFARSGRQAGAMAAALQRGVDVHRLTRAIDETGDYEDALDDDFDPANPSAETINFVAAYRAFLDLSDYRPIAWETIVYSPPPLEYAGKTDAVGWLGPQRVLLDRKTERSLHKAVWVQLGAYKQAWNLCHPTEPIDRTYALVLKADMTFELRPNPIEGEALHYFVAAWWIHRWHHLAF
jgi:hypothetical protein